MRCSACTDTCMVRVREYFAVSSLCWMVWRYCCLVALAVSIKHKSELLMNFALPEMFSYFIIVIIARVNTP
nr:MAG TPA: 4Fe-4S binding domain protein [Caudoviricetes sp.]